MKIKLVTESDPQGFLEIELDKPTIHRIDAYAIDRGLTFDQALKELLTAALEDITSNKAKYNLQ